MALRLGDEPRLLRRFVDREQQITALRLRVGVRLRRRFKDGRRPVHRVHLCFHPARRRILHRRFDGEFFRRDEIAQRVARTLGPGHFLQGKRLVAQRVLAFVEQRLAGQRREFDQILLGTERQHGVLQVAFAGARRRQDLRRERIVQLAARHHEVEDETVALFADDAEFAEVAGDGSREIGAAAQLQRFRSVLRGQRQGHGPCTRRLLAPAFRRDEQPRKVVLRRLHRQAEHPRRLRREEPPGA